MPDTLYDSDFYGWTQEQARALRRLAEERSNVPLDLENLAEEIESLGISDRRALENALKRVIEHLLKLEFSPAADPRNGWRRSVREHRFRVAEMGGRSRRLENLLPDLFQGAWAEARALAAGSLADEDAIDPATLPPDCPYTLDRICDHGWWPGNRHGLD